MRAYQEAFVSVSEGFGDLLDGEGILAHVVSCDGAEREWMGRGVGLTDTAEKADKCGGRSRNEDTKKYAATALAPPRTRCISKRCKRVLLGVLVSCGFSTAIKWGLLGLNQPRALWACVVVDREIVTACESCCCIFLLVHEDMRADNSPLGGRERLCAFHHQPAFTPPPPTPLRSPLPPS